jgi:hypothetical protein
MLKFQWLSTNNKGATKTSKKLGNYHNFGEPGQWAHDCMKNLGGDGKDKMKNKLKDKSNCSTNILVDDK